MASEEKAAINSELRFITLELMKIAARKRLPFKQIAGEFISNVYLLEKQIRQKTPSFSMPAAKAKWADRKDRI
ncbi:hypothetical protein FJZ26_01795 [Candidatus Parvarchaeota archaeon]|nr:hypothetical protein [Candidatus Parvarchaeota archaeon]